MYYIITQISILYLTKLILLYMYMYYLQVHSIYIRHFQIQVEKGPYRLPTI